MLTIVGFIRVRPSPQSHLNTTSGALSPSHTSLIPLRRPPITNLTSASTLHIALHLLTDPILNTILTGNSLHSVTVSPECITAFNELKLGKDIKWIIYKISDDWKEIVVDEKSTEDDYAAFREKLLSAKSTWKGKEGLGGRYAVFDVAYDTAGEGKRSVSDPRRTIPAFER
jgi:hypothetical protein